MLLLSQLLIELVKCLLNSCAILRTHDVKHVSFTFEKRSSLCLIHLTLSKITFGANHQHRQIIISIWDGSDGCLNEVIQFCHRFGIVHGEDWDDGACSVIVRLCDLLLLFHTSCVKVRHSDFLARDFKSLVILFLACCGVLIIVKNVIFMFLNDIFYPFFSKSS